MNLSLYSAATGMEAQQLNLNTIANNLANVNTTGFKRSKIEFQDLLYQKPRSAGAEAAGGNVIPTGIEIGNGSRVAATSKVFTQGQVTQTGKELDIAIQGDGFFEVQRPDGTTAYTRDGSFKLNASGQVVTSDGLPVLSGFQAVPTGTTSISIAETGEVTVEGASGSQTYRISLTRFANPAGLKSLGGNLYEETNASGTPEQGNPGEQGFGQVLQRYLEGSNVNIVEEMVNLIVAQRAYEINSKSIQTSDEMLQNVAQMKR
ncbi:MAG TPA: flagellar basal-body rod protein FlgG [Opitutaceae bacterium]|jgi:flagellar basal-body rod protein FlgG|nr:flagellar basal-body rod protein FlgG [Opitutaceae bacterium]OQB96645.1 MAG: Flagellar basal-body rod protein FlgG [Verrucomicrobia bacterium ADurb.Bin122]HOF10250.1 flagellar basal-body rod protein FlgG [Opitutaceae bacterium]HOG92146.1 flagellar basal-body rod protein FlgG [Opitutaceae bacterium]HOR26327.1 flagellar basal-body rod protein FlgG [Opitutaceae bacterium]